MAYTLDINVQCDAPGCLKQARQEVFNTYNASVGRFCKADAHLKLIALLKIERDKTSRRESEVR